jgi:hypothetical protein
MEAVAYVAGEPWSDHPQCVCPVIAAFCRTWNDNLSDEQRDALLRPLIPSLIGTRATPEAERARAYLAADYACRVAAPAALRAVGLDAHADTLERLDPVTCQVTALVADLTASLIADVLLAAGDLATHTAIIAVGAGARSAASAAEDARGASAARAAARAIHSTDVVGLVQQMIRTTS